MTVLILGAEGMLGLALCREFAARPPAGEPIVASVREAAPRVALPEGLAVAPFVDAMRLDTVKAALARVRPTVVINAIGIVKHRLAQADLERMTTVNGLFPHRLAALCQERGVRLLHISTDCVFDGRRGLYSETDAANARDAYGHSKALGEVASPHAMTLRTSMIGLPSHAGRGLLAWFLAGDAPVKGYTNAVFSGPTAPELARLVGRIVASPAPFGGLLNVAAAPIDKFSLLTMVREAFGLRRSIAPDGTLRIDRSLCAGRLAARYGYEAPPWRAMVEELAAQWREGAMGGGPRQHVLA